MDPFEEISGCLEKIKEDRYQDKLRIRELEHIVESLQPVAARAQMKFDYGGEKHQHD